MEQYPTIYLFKGATSIVEVDLSDFALQGGKIVLTVRRTKGACEVVKTWEFDKSGEHKVVFEDEFTATLEVGSDYEYDFMWLLDGERFPQCLPSPIEVVRTVGGLPHGAEG